IPESLSGLDLTASEDGLTLSYVSHGESDTIGIADLVRQFDRAGIAIKTIDMKRSSLEDIFVDLVEDKA
ncbi:MAG: multidrug ABC transporter ATP-binding protein, partial [Sphingomonadaceae bacterium]